MRFNKKTCFTKDILQQEYIFDKSSLRSIGKKYNTSAQVILYWLKEFGIPRRTVSSALIGRKLSKEHKENIGRASSLRKHTKEAKNKISEANKGKTRMLGKHHTHETKEKMRQKALGRKMSPEAKKKISEWNIKRFDGNPENHPLFGKPRDDIRGEKHWNWNNGATILCKSIRSTLEYKQWRHACFKRDNWTCQICNQHGGALHVDHIKTYAYLIKQHMIMNVKDALLCNELWDINNGRTLCIKCHKKTPTYGRPAKYNKGS